MGCLSYTRPLQQNKTKAEMDLERETRKFLIDEEIKMIEKFVLILRDDLDKLHSHQGGQYTEHLLNAQIAMLRKEVRANEDRSKFLKEERHILTGTTRNNENQGI